MLLISGIHSNRMKLGYKKIINILKKADNSTFLQGQMIYDDESENMRRYCSLGLVAKELGYDEYIGHTKFLMNKLNLDIEELRLVTHLNDVECDSYQCVANELESRLK